MAYLYDGISYTDKIAFYIEIGQGKYELTHWCLLMEISFMNWVIYALGNGLASVYYQTITHTNACLVSKRPLEINFSEIWIKIQQFSIKKIYLNMSSANGGHFVQASFCQMS